MRIDGKRAVLCPVAQVFGHRRRIHDFAGIHPAFRIKGGLDVLESLVNLGTEELCVQMTAGEAVSVLSAHATAELHDEIRDFICHFLHDADIPCILCIDERPDVQAANAGVTVIACASPVFVNHVSKPNEKLRKL